MAARAEVASTDGTGLAAAPPAPTRWTGCIARRRWTCRCWWPATGRSSTLEPDRRHEPGGAAPQGAADAAPQAASAATAAQPVQPGAMAARRWRRQRPRLTRQAARPGQPQVVADAAPDVVMFAVRPSWVRVRAADGTVLFEKILDAGERYVLPKTEEPPTLRTGNAGAIYSRSTARPMARPARARRSIKNVALSVDHADREPTRWPIPAPTPALRRAWSRSSPRPDPPVAGRAGRRLIGAAACHGVAASRASRPRSSRDPTRPERHDPCRSIPSVLGATSSAASRGRSWSATVPVGGDAPISVQTMTNTDTSDVRATLAQVIEVRRGRRRHRARLDPGRGARRARCSEIVRESPVPIVADIHFHYKRAIEAAEAGAACLRINPGNIGDEKRVARGDPRGEGPRLFDPHRRECRLARTRPAGEIWRALPRRRWSSGASTTSRSCRTTISTSSRSR